MRCVPILVGRYQSMTRKGRLLQFVTMYNSFSPLRQTTLLCERSRDCSIRLFHHVYKISEYDPKHVCIFSITRKF